MPLLPPKIISSILYTFCCYFRSDSFLPFKFSFHHHQQHIFKEKWKRESGRRKHSRTSIATRAREKDAERIPTDTNVQTSNTQEMKQNSRMMFGVWVCFRTSSMMMLMMMMMLAQYALLNPFIQYIVRLGSVRFGLVDWFLYSSSLFLAHTHTHEPD